MAISNYEKNGRQLFRVYIQAQGKQDRSLRIQRTKFNIETLKDARREEKKLIKAVAEEISKLEGRGLKWDDLIDRWEVSASLGHLGDKYQNRALVRDHVNRLNRYTKPWFNKIASDLTKGDGRLILNQAKEIGSSTGLLKNIKSSVNVVFKWAVEEKFILGVHSSPTEGLLVSDKSEKVPMILSMEEIKKLLLSAKEQDHPWYHIWSFAFLTGMRSGELKALQWKDFDFEKDIIVVSKSFNSRTRSLKCTKAGYWRNVPISKELYQCISELKNNSDCDPESFVLPRHGTWTGGESGKVLRAFLSKLGVERHVVFHTLRACFATHMLALGVDQATVMKIGGWRDIKTFQIYIRLAGIEVKGATDVLQILPQMDSLMKTENVINLFELNQSMQ